MKWYWSCTCAKCGKEIASGDRLDMDFKRAEWTYDRTTHTWNCPECSALAATEKEGGAK